MEVAARQADAITMGNNALGRHFKKSRRTLLVFGITGKGMIVIGSCLSSIHYHTSINPPKEAAQTSREAGRKRAAIPMAIVGFTKYSNRKKTIIYGRFGSPGVVEPQSTVQREWDGWDIWDQWDGRQWQRHWPGLLRAMVLRLIERGVSGFCDLMGLYEKLNKFVFGLKKRRFAGK